MSTYAPPEDFLAIADAAAGRRLARLSAVRETFDGDPIGWIMRLTAQDNTWVSIFGGSGLRCYMDGEALTVTRVRSWLEGLPPAIDDPEIIEMFGLAVRNAWEVTLQNQDNSCHAPHLVIADLLSLKAEAPDFETSYGRDRRYVDVSRYEGEQEFNVVMRSDDETDSLYPVHIAVEEARALLGATAPMSVPTRVLDFEE